MQTPRLPYGGATWVDHVARHAFARPDEPALRFLATTITWSQLHARAQRLAAALTARGVGRGDRVAVLMTNRPEYVEAVLAINALGAIAVPVNFRLAVEEAAFVLAHSGARVVLTDAGLTGLARAAAESAGEGLRVIATGIDDDPGNVESYERVVDSMPDAPAGVEIDEHDVAFIMYTSGTTGRPKGAMLTHLNMLLSSVTSVYTHQFLGHDDVALINVPLFHIAGTASLAPGILLGFPAVIMPSTPFDADETLEVVETERVTSLFLVPAQWQVMCAHPDATRRTRSLRTILWGAAPTTVRLLEKMAQTFPDTEIVSVFGQTEMSPVTTWLPSTESIRKIGSVGRPIPFVAIRVVDEQMNDVPRGEAGEIVYRGPTMMAGYWDNPAATDEAMAGGWFHSGDLVRVDDEGYVYVVDRKKDMIISGGENIYCAEVENALAAHPGVADVAIIGAKHERWGETPIAVIVPADPAAPPTLTQLTGFLRDKIASYKKPTALVVVGELPRNASGKVVKDILRTRHAPDLFRG